MTRILLFFLLFFLIVCPCIAVRQGTATADIFIKRYTQSGDFGRLALWHEAAAECLKRISVPMNQIAHDYYVRHGYKTWAARAKKEAQEIQEQYQSHRARAEIAWRKFMEEVCNPNSLSFVGGICNPDSVSEQQYVGEVCNLDSFSVQRFVGGVCNPNLFSVLTAECENIKKFITTWLPHYPDRFYEFGIYPTFFRKQRKLAEQVGDYVKALRLEADAAAMCTAQYEQIPIAYGLRNYEKHRDAYRQYASHLRNLAQQNPNALPPVVDKGRQISDSLAIQTVSAQQKADAILQIAKSDARIKAALAGQLGVHAYPTFQGFAWIVSFSNHSRGNIAIAIVDEKTAEVLDVF